MLSEAQSILLDAGMTLSKWHNNNNSLIKQHYQYFEHEVDKVTKCWECVGTPLKMSFHFKDSAWAKKLI